MRLPKVNDALKAGTDQMEALMALPRSMVVLNRSVSNLADTVTALDQLVRRLDRLTATLEKPLTALGPRLEALVSRLDEEVLVPVPQDAGPALELMGETRNQLASIATSVEQLLSIMEGGFARVEEMRGAFLVSRLRAAGRAPRPASAPVAAAPGAPPDDAAPAGPGAPPDDAAPAGPASPHPQAAPSRPAATRPAVEEHRSWRA